MGHGDENVHDACYSCDEKRVAIDLLTDLMENLLEENHELLEQIGHLENKIKSLKESISAV